VLIFQTKAAEAGFDFTTAVAFEVFADQTLTSTTNQPPNWVTKLSGQTTEAELAGTYVIQWAAEMSNGNNNAVVNFRVQWKSESSSTWITLTELDPTIVRSNSYIALSGFRVVEQMLNEKIDFRLQFARTDGTALIRAANLYIFRVGIE
jgi:hypothetical protein